VGVSALACLCITFLERDDPFAELITIGTEGDLTLIRLFCHVHIPGLEQELVGSFLASGQPNNLRGFS